MSEREYDLVVVGAGPAGSSAAYAAAKNGIKVALLEKEENVAQTVRTSGVTWIDYAKEFGIPEDCYNPIRTYKFCSPNNTKSQLVMTNQRLQYWTYERHTGFWQTRQKRMVRKFSSTQT